jgi:hypothetical protein
MHFKKIEQAWVPRVFVKKDSYGIEDAEIIFKHKDGLYAHGAKKAGAYQTIRDIARANGLIDESRRETVNKPFEKPQAVLSEETIKARMEFSQDFCKKMFAGQHTGAADSDLNKLKTDSPAKYKRLQAAARSYGVIADAVNVVDHRHPQATVRAVEDGRSPLAPECCVAFNLPLGHRVSADEFAQLLRLRDEVAAMQKAEQEATA